MNGVAMGKQVSQDWLIFSRMCVSAGILCSATSVSAEFSQDSSALPQFGHVPAISESVSAANGGTENASLERERQNRFRDRLTSKLNLDIGDSVRVGVQRFTKHNGKRRYGLGIRKQLEDRELNLMLTSSGVNVNTQLDTYGVGLVLENHAPGDDDSSTYVGVGVNRRF